MSDYKSLFKHSRNYFFATIATKALSFISIPVYTRLLTLEDYGIVNVFMSLVGVVAVFLTLSSEVSIGRYYYDAEDIEDFKRFVGTSVRLTSFILIGTTILFIIGLNLIADIVDLPRRLTLCLIPVALFNVTNSIFTQIYNPLMQSKKIAIVSSVQSYTSFAISVICVILIKEEKYYGIIYGNIIAMFIFGYYMIKQIKPYYISCFHKHYLPYIFKYCLPYIPDTLSGIILAQFSKIFIGNNQGYAMAGTYSFVVNLATLMSVVVYVTNNTWIPFFFRYMNSKDYKSINNDFNLIWRLTLVVAIGLSFWGKEIAEVLAHNDYLEMLPVFPLLVSGYVIHQWAYLYLRNIGYSKRMMWNTYCYMFSGCSLVVLNLLLVPKFSGYGAAVSTLLSYVFLLLFAYIVNRFVICLYAPSMIKCLKPFMIYIAFTIVSIFLFYWDTNFVIFIFSKVVLCCFAILILLYPFLQKVRPIIRSKF